LVRITASNQFFFSGYYFLPPVFEPDFAAIQTTAQFWIITGIDRFGTIPDPSKASDAFGRLMALSPWPKGNAPGATTEAYEPIRRKPVESLKVEREMRAFTRSGGRQRRRTCPCESRRCLMVISYFFFGSYQEARQDTLTTFRIF